MGLQGNRLTGCDLKVYSVMVTAIDFHDCIIVCFGHSPLLFMFPCVVYASILISAFLCPFWTIIP